MSNNEFDLEQFARLFDAALASDNPAIKKALRNLMMIASIVDAENSDPIAGPLWSTIHNSKLLESRVLKLENQMIALTTDVANRELNNYDEWTSQYTTKWPNPYTDTVRYRSNKLAGYSVPTGLIDKGKP